MAQTKLINVDTSKAQSNVKALDDGVKQLNKDLGTTNDAGKNIDALGSSVSKATSNIGKNLTAATKDFQGLNKAVNDVKFDIGSIGPSVAKLGAGIAGGFNIVSGALKLMGGDSEETTKAVTELQFFLQEIPLQFFAIAEGIESTTSVFNSFKSLFADKSLKGIISTFALGGKQALAESSEYAVTALQVIPKNLKEIYKDFVDIEALLDTFTPKLSKLYSDWDREEADLNNKYAALFSNLKNVANAEEYRRKQIELTAQQGQEYLDIQLKYQEQQKNIYADIAQEMSSVIKKTYLLQGGIIALVAALGAVVATNVVSYFKDMDEAAQKLYEHTRDLFSINTTGLKDAQKQITIVQTLVRNAKDENNSLENRISAIKQLNELVPGYNGQLNTTSGLYQENTKALNDYISELKRQAIAVAAVESITKKYQTIIEKSADLQLAENLKKEMEAVQAEYDAAYKTTGISVELRERYDALMSRSNKKIIENIDNLKEEIVKEQQDIEYIYTTFDTNIKPAVTKAGASVGAKAGETIKKEVIEALKPSKQELEAFTENWIGNIPLTESGQLLAERIQNEINLTGIGDSDPLTVKINIAVGDFPENERLRQYLDFITESQRQLAVLNDTMSRFGESSLGLTGSWQNVVSDFSNTFAQLANNIAKGENSFSNWTQMAASGIQSVGTLLNALSDEQDSSTKQGFEAQKKYQISATVMNTLAGIINAWSSALSITPPVGPILGAANSAMIAALGAVQIAKIKNQRFGEEGNVSSSAVNSTLIAPTQYSQAVQNANIESKLGDNRVFVTETDISNTQNRVRVQESENTY